MCATGILETDSNRNIFLVGYKVWNHTCEGKLVRAHCIYGVGDLPALFNSPELFANRFHIDFEPEALDCMEELHYYHSRDELEGRAPALNISYYAGMYYAKNHVEVTTIGLHM